MSRLLLLALFVSTAAFGVQAAPPPKGAKSQLLFVSARTGTANIFLIDEDGTNEKNLTDSKATNAYPAWSPDGSKIAFCSDRDGTTHVYVMDADGKNVKAVTKGDQACRVPSWSADGKTIAFCRAGNQSDVCVVSAGGGDPKVIQEDGWDPVFSPDGKSIAFVTPRDGDGFRLYTMTAEGKDAKNLYPKGNPIGFAYPSWSPDSKKVIWAHGAGEGLDLHAVDADGKNPEQLTKLGGFAVYPAWAPSGKKIVFFKLDTLDNDPKGTLQVMDADGKNAKVLVKDETLVEGGRPAWKP